jgi:hypothetical protein
MMTNFRKIAAYNLIALLIYTVLANVAATGKERQLGVMILLAGLVSLHVAGNLLAAIVFFIQRNNAKSKAFLLSALIVLLIGFSACWGSASL